MRILSFWRVATLAVLWSAATVPASAAEPSAANLSTAQAYVADIVGRDERGDIDGASDAARDAIAWARKTGDGYLVGYFTSSFVRIQGKRKRYDLVIDEIAPVAAAVAENSVDVTIGDEILDRVTDAAFRQGRSDIAKAASEALLARVAKRDGAQSDAVLSLHMRIAFNRWHASQSSEDLRALTLAVDAAEGRDDASFYLRSLNQAAQWMREADTPQEAEGFYVRGVNSKAAQTPSVDLGFLFHNYALLLADHGAHNQAIPLYIRSLDIMKELKGDRSAEVVEINGNLSLLLSQSGKLASAQTSFEATYERAVEVLGPDDPRTLSIANNYAGLLRLFDRPSKALEIDSAIYERRAAAAGMMNDRVLFSANNVGTDLIAAEQFAEADRFLSDVIAAIDAGRSEVGARFSAFADTAKMLRRYARLRLGSETVSRRDIEAAVELRDTSLLASEAVRFGMFYAQAAEALGDRDLAAALYDETNQVAERSHGVFHPLSFRTLLTMGQAARRFRTENGVVIYDVLEQHMFPWMRTEINNAGNRNSSEGVRILADEMFADLAEMAEADPAAAEILLRAVSRWQTMPSDDAVEVRTYAAKAASPALRAAAGDVMKLEREALAVFSSAGYSDTGGYDEEGLKLATAVLRKRETLREIVAEEASYKMLPDAPDADLRSALSEKQALVAFFESRRWPKRSEGATEPLTTRLYAILVRPRQPTAVIALGDGNEVELLLSTLALASPPEGVIRRLGAVLFEPLAPKLSGVDRLFVVPSGMLSFAPFSGLTDAAGRRLSDRYDLRLLTSVDAVRFQDDEARNRLDPGDAVLVVGDLSYGEGGASPLPGTKREAEAIATTLSAEGYPVERFGGEDGTEAGVGAAVRGSAIVHLATHGFYDPYDSATDPIWRSGIVFSSSGKSGAGKPDAGDGVLYGGELMRWDLSKTELAVLSACDTGLGGLSYVFGVEGLPSALATAGSSRSVVSLWRVRDIATAHFMRHFYQRLLIDKDYETAFAATKKDAAAGKIDGASDPAVWMAFEMYAN